jgi:hypothetical protein
LFFDGRVLNGAHAHIQYARIHHGYIVSERAYVQQTTCTHRLAADGCAVPPLNGALAACVPPFDEPSAFTAAAVAIGAGSTGGAGIEDVNSLLGRSRRKLTGPRVVKYESMSAFNWLGMICSRLAAIFGDCVISRSS